MSTYRDRRKDAQRAERTVPICLAGHLVADWERADRELQRAQKEGSNSLEGGGVGELVDQVRTLESAMREHTDQFRLRAMPRHEFRALIADHPPRLGDDGDPVREDAQVGVNRETFFAALIRASVVEPALDDEDWAFLLGDAGKEGVLTDRQFTDLEDAAWFLNRGEVNVPFSHAASIASRNFGDE